VSTHPRTLLRDERGIALITVLLITFVVAALAVGAAMITMNAGLITRFGTRQSLLGSVADAGIAKARATVNANKALYPDSGYTVLENGVAVTDANGDTIPFVHRWTYVGPTGITTGQYGVFGSIVSVAKDAFGDEVIRRGEVVQESFAKYAYFTDIEPSNISFGGGDQIWGPVHTNDYLKIYSSGATFHGPAETAKKVQGGQYATFDQGYTENAPYIAMPQTADLTKLQVQAAKGNTAFTGTTVGTTGQATIRIEFVALDLNGDGDSTDANEGFIRVYQSNDPAWVVADVPSGGMRNSQNCGHYEPNGSFVTAAAHPNNGPDSWKAALSSSTKRCYLGGSDSLSGGFVAADGQGQWLKWPGAVSPLVAGRPDAQYLFPISRQLNPDFKGVIYVDGNVAISGKVRGRVTLAATGNIVIADDIAYATNPGAGTCADILGMFSGNDVVVADNTLNAPQIPANGQNYFTYDDTKDEFIDGVVLALDVFTVEDYASGATKAEPCENELWGRGCLYLTGGIIQKTRGAVGTIGSVGGTGYVKRYSYDACAYSDPPPYFPTTGHFARGRFFEVNPVGFSVDSLYKMLTPQGN